MWLPAGKIREILLESKAGRGGGIGLRVRLKIVWE